MSCHSPKKAGRLSVSLLWVVFGLWIATSIPALSLLGWWTLIDTKAPLTVIHQVGEAAADKAVSPKVTRGGLLMISRSYCVANTRPGSVVRQIIDTIVLNYPKSDAPSEVGCYEGRTHAIEVPTMIPNGHYIFRERVLYDLNPLTQREVLLPDIKFEVVDEPSKRDRQRASAEVDDGPPAN